MFSELEPFHHVQLRNGFGRGVPVAPPRPSFTRPPQLQKWTIGMIRMATMLATLIIGLIAGPAVSL
jgi:hypothetical protein